MLNVLTLQTASELFSLSGIIKCQKKNLPLPPIAGFICATRCYQPNRSGCSQPPLAELDSCWHATMFALFCIPQGGVD